MRVGGAVAVLETVRYFSELSMELDLAKEVKELKSAVERAAQWDPGLRSPKMARQVCH